MAPSETRSAADQAFLDAVSISDLRRFRYFVYSEAFIDSHRELFIDDEWVDVRRLRLFLTGHSARSPVIISSSPPPSPKLLAPHAQTRVKKGVKRVPTSDSDEGDALLVANKRAEVERVRAASLANTHMKQVEREPVSDSDEGGALVVPPKCFNVECATSRNSFDTGKKRVQRAVSDSDEGDTLVVPTKRVKVERIGVASLASARPQPHLRRETRSPPAFTTTRSGGKEVLEIITDSEDDNITETTTVGARALSATADPAGDAEVSSPSSFSRTADTEDDSGSYTDKDSEVASNSEDEEPSKQLQLASLPTDWQDSSIASTFTVNTDELPVTRQCKVIRVERLDVLPQFWPVPRVPTAYVIDLSRPEYQIKENDVLMTPDALIRNHDQDCWSGGSGTGDDYPRVHNIFSEAVPCRRIRLKCRGSFACKYVDSSLVDVTRFELDLSAREAIIAAEISRRQDAERSNDSTIATFLNVCTTKGCFSGCEGGKPIMVRQPKPFRGKNYFIGCSNWSPVSRSHRSIPIPDHIDEELLSRALRNERVKAASETETCSRVISAHIGMKSKTCGYPHFDHDGRVAQAKMVHRECPAKRTIFVPCDMDQHGRVAIVVPDHTQPHNRPMPFASKASRTTRNVYAAKVRAHGVLGATPAVIDHAATSKVIDATSSTPAVHLSLVSKRIKREVVRREKLKASPAGLGIPGVWDLFRKERELDPQDRYIYAICTTPAMHIMIFTFDPFLLSLIHSAISFEVDTTFKRTHGTLNEWEIVIWYSAVNRLVTIGRVYTDGKDRSHYKLLFDKLQEAVLELTGKPLRFARFTEGGTLLGMNVDLKAAQVLGAADSFLPTNDPEYSGIHTEKPEEFATYFIRACLVHVKRPLLDFKGVLTPDEYNYIINFPYIETQEDFDKFSCWCLNHHVEKIRTWWKNKIDNSWMAGTIIKSQSNMDPKHWDLLRKTTNGGESQHHWTNKLTGTNLPPVEAIQNAKGVDKGAKRDIKTTVTTGVLPDTQNEDVHRLSRNTQRGAAAMQKARNSTKQNEAQQLLRMNIEAERQARRDSTQREKGMQAALKEAQNKAPNGKGAQRSARQRPSSSGEASSCGRVKTKAQGAREPVPKRVVVDARGPLATKSTANTAAAEPADVNDSNAAAPVLARDMGDFLLYSNGTDERTENVSFDGPGMRNKYTVNGLEDVPAWPADYAQQYDVPAPFDHAYQHGMPAPAPLHHADQHDVPATLDHAYQYGVPTTFEGGYGHNTPNPVDDTSYAKDLAFSHPPAYLDNAYVYPAASTLTTPPEMQHIYAKASSAPHNTMLASSSSLAGALG